MKSDVDTHLNDAIEYLTPGIDVLANSFQQTTITMEQFKEAMRLLDGVHERRRVEEMTETEIQQLRELSTFGMF